MDNKNIPYFVHEGEMVRMERIVKRLWITVILLIVLLVATNTVWIIYENSFEEVVVTQENEDGYNSFIGEDGTIIN